MSRPRGVGTAPGMVPAASASRLGWVRRWGVSVCSLSLGFATLFVFRRGLPHVGWIAGYLLLLWLAFAVATEVRDRLEERGWRRAVTAGDYAIQTLCHDLLLFVLPAYYASATLDSPNGVFLAAVAAGAVITAVDPWFQRIVRRRSWPRDLLFGFSSFAALNVSLPLVGVPPILAVEASAALSMLALVPAFRRTGASWREATARGVILACAALAVGWYGRALVPPAPLFLARAVAARAVTGLEPIDVIAGSIPAQTLADWGSLAAFTPVYAPSGLRQRIYHVWSQDGVPFARIALAPVRGGRADGFRTYSVTRNLPARLAGRYTVDVVTGAGQLVGRLRFTVAPEVAMMGR